MVERPGDLAGLGLGEPVLHDRDVQLLLREMGAEDRAEAQQGPPHEEHRPAVDILVRLVQELADDGRALNRRVEVSVYPVESGG